MARRRYRKRAKKQKISPINRAKTSHGNQKVKVNDGISHTKPETSVPSTSTANGTVPVPDSDTSLIENNAAQHKMETESQLNPIWFVLNNSNDKHTSKCKLCRKYFKKRFKGNLSKLEKIILVKCVRTRAKRSPKSENRHDSQVLEETRGTKLLTSEFFKQVKESFDNETKFKFFLESFTDFQKKAISYKELIKRIKPILKTKRQLFKRFKSAIANNEMVVDDELKQVDGVSENTSPMEVGHIPACNLDEPSDDKVSEISSPLEVELTPACSLDEPNELDTLRRSPEATLSNKSREDTLGSIPEASIPNITTSTSIPEISVPNISTEVSSTSTENDFASILEENASRIILKARLSNISIKNASESIQEASGSHISTVTSSGSIPEASNPETSTWRSIPAEPLPSTSSSDVNFYLGSSGAVNPYVNCPSTCKLMTKKSEQLLSSLDADARKQSNRPMYKEISTGTRGMCSGKTILNDEILNETYAIVDGKKFKTRNPVKSEFDKKIFECEDQMFEIDVLIQSAESTFNKLQKVYEHLSGMTKTERDSFILPVNIDGSSDVLHQKSFERLFGENCAECLYNFTHNPFACIPFVLNLLSEQIIDLKLKKRNKQIECHDVLKEFYPKSLDHQGKKFRQLDRQYLSSKYLEEEIEAIYNMRVATTVGISNDNQNQADLDLIYKDRNILYSVADLIIHYVRTHSKFDNEEKINAEHIIFHVIPDIFAYKRTKLNELEDDYEDPFGCDTENIMTQSILTPNFSLPKDQNINLVSEHGSFNQKVDETYTLFFGNTHWYIFLRLHHILCNRLNRLYEISIALPEESNDQTEMYLNARDLHLTPKGKTNKQDSYKNFLQELKNLLDGLIDNNLYEERLREIFGINAYIGYTMDIVISNAVDQVLHLIRNTISKNCIKLMYQQANNGGSGGPCQTLLLRKEAELLHEAIAKGALAQTTSYKIILYNNNNEMKLIIKTLGIQKKPIKLSKCKKKQLCRKNEN